LFVIDFEYKFEERKNRFDFVHGVGSAFVEIVAD
jgi:hypothetical protein